MTTYLQETDSKMVFPFKKEAIYSLPIRPVDATTGSDVKPQYIPLPRESGLIKSAWVSIRQSENINTKDQARDLLLLIQDILSDLQQYGFNIGYLPKIYAFNIDDGSILLEWIFKDYRLGFTVEPNPQDSGWYLVTTEKLSNISASGYIIKDNFRTDVLWLLNYIISHT